MDSMEAQPEETAHGVAPVVEAAAAGPTATDANADAVEALWSTVHTAVSSPFPRRLYRLLETEDPAVISWNEDGTSFRINDAALFSSDILPKYFRHSKITSFQRQLNLYGFTLASRSALAGSYQHPLFHKGREDALDNIRRAPKKRAASPSSAHDPHGGGAQGGHAAAAQAAAAAMGGLLVPGGLMGGGGPMPGFPNPNDPNGLASMMMWPSLYQYQAAFQQQQMQQQQQQLHPSFQQHMPPGFFPHGTGGLPPEAASAWGGYGVGNRPGSSEGATAAELAAASTAGSSGGAAEHVAEPSGLPPVPSPLVPSSLVPPPLVPPPLGVASSDPEEAAAAASEPPPPAVLPEQPPAVAGEQEPPPAAKRLKSSAARTPEELQHAFSPQALAGLDGAPFEPLAARLAASLGYGRALALALAVAAQGGGGLAAQAAAATGAAAAVEGAGSSSTDAPE